MKTFFKTKPVIYLVRNNYIALLLFTNAKLATKLFKVSKIRLEQCSMNVVLTLFF